MRERERERERRREVEKTGLHTYNIEITTLRLFCNISESSCVSVEPCQNDENFHQLDFSVLFFG